MYLMISVPAELERTECTRSAVMPELGLLVNGRERVPDCTLAVLVALLQIEGVGRK